jgi:hypothetical protein
MNETAIVPFMLFYDVLTFSLMGSPLEELNKHGEVLWHQDTKNNAIK